MNTLRVLIGLPPKAMPSAPHAHTWGAWEETSRRHYAIYPEDTKTDAKGNVIGIPLRNEMRVVQARHCTLCKLAEYRSDVVAA